MPEKTCNQNSCMLYIVILLMAIAVFTVSVVSCFISFNVKEEKFCTCYGEGKKNCTLPSQRMDEYNKGNTEFQDFNKTYKEDLTYGWKNTNFSNYTDKNNWKTTNFLD